VLGNAHGPVAIVSDLTVALPPRRPSEAAAGRAASIAAGRTFTSVPSDTLPSDGTDVCTHPRGAGQRAEHDRQLPLR
jgi:hypothetical protein